MVRKSAASSWPSCRPAPNKLKSTFVCCFCFCFCCCCCCCCLKQRTSIINHRNKQRPRSWSSIHKEQSWNHSQLHISNRLDLLLFSFSFSSFSSLSLFVSSLLLASAFPLLLTFLLCSLLSHFSLLFPPLYLLSHSFPSFAFSSTLCHMHGKLQMPNTQVSLLESQLRIAQASTGKSTTPKVNRDFCLFLFVCLSVRERCEMKDECG